MNETEKQNRIRIETMKLQKLSNIISAATEAMFNFSTNIRRISDYNDSSKIYDSNIQLFQTIEDYKILLTDSEEELE